jgi:hypothetical protein
LAVGLIVLAFAVTHPFPASASTVIPKKTTVELELLENVNSKLNRTGEIISLVVAEDVMVDGHVVFEQGTPVEARVKYAQKSRTNGRPGVLQIVVPRVATATGREVSMFGELVASGKHRSGSAAAASVIAGAGFLGMRGRQAFHLKGGTFEVLTRNEETLDLDVPPALRPAPGSTATPLVAQPEPTEGPVAATERVSYMPRKGNLSGDITLTFPVVDGRGAPQHVEIREIDGLLLPHPLPAIEVEEGKQTWEAIFDDWSLVRYMTGSKEGRANEVGAILRFADGSEIPATATVVLELKVK